MNPSPLYELPQGKTSDLAHFFVTQNPEHIQIRVVLPQWKWAQEIQEGFRNWGIWQGDVVEVFVQWPNSHRYLELQVSNLGQGFALWIERPRLDFEYPSGKFWHWEVKPYGKSGSEVLFQIPHQGDSSGCKGFVAIQKNTSTPSYLLCSAQLEKIDFHQPHLFHLLGTQR